MVRIPVTSSTIVSVGYDEATLTLHVEVRRRGGSDVYEFRGVTRAHHDAFMAAPSLGSHFARHIRGRYVESRRLDGVAQ